MNSHIKLFNRIAYFYSKFFKGQVKGYKYAIRKVKPMLTGKTVLDIGCGTGTLSRAMYENGYKVTGIDGSPNMIRESKNMNKETTIEFKVGNFLEGLDYPDSSFDIVTAAFVAHGLKKEQRKIFYKEGYRLAKKVFILFDYSKTKIGFFMQLIELIEKGDYFNFYKNSEKELKDLFPSLQIIDIEKTSCWYVVNKK